MVGKKHKNKHKNKEKSEEKQKEGKDRGRDAEKHKEKKEKRRCAVAAFSLSAVLLSHIYLMLISFLLFIGTDRIVPTRPSAL